MDRYPYLLDCVVTKAVPFLDGTHTHPRALRASDHTHTHTHTHTIYIYIYITVGEIVAVLCGVDKGIHENEYSPFGCPIQMHGASRTDLTRPSHMLALSIARPAIAQTSWTTP
eukprot:COSAG05_NODE_975_length_6350_cov_6.983523_4_plen_113_part_00